MLMQTMLSAGAAEAAVRALIAGGALDPVAMAFEAAEDGSGLRAFSAAGAAAGSDSEEACTMAGGGQRQLAPQEALLWCVL